MSHDRPARDPGEGRPTGYRPTHDWPRWTSGTGAGGTWKASTEDFQVTEIPLVTPTGTGEHQWLRIEKIGLTTLDVVDALCSAANVPPDNIGYAGLKDRFARTVQDFTIQLGREVTALPDGMRILERTRTARRLRSGQLVGNTFSLLVRGGDATVARERLERLRVTGMPNYYGAQRVGGTAPGEGRAILLGGGPRLRHNQLKFVLSAYQSLLFNRVLAARGPTRLEGDLDEDGIPTGPMFGPTMRMPTGAALALEQRILVAEGLPERAWSHFEKLTQGTRRKLWVPVEAELEEVAGGFWLRFRLPAGSYATELLEEIL
ncbi:MAG: tRNA pseudouridine(13) synthase TruD [Pseudomonadota bacterium]|nr:tRNA pseudouridine(13) synthase TruD [Pseudomonadota bacterium]